MTAALTLLHSACKKRKEMLRKTMNLLLSIIQTPGTNPSLKNYEYKKAEERAPLREAMNLLLPQLYGIITQVENSGAR